MKAFVLAGGVGTRLRPLSCTRPKLLFPICNTPLLDWTIENLNRSGIKEIILAVNYMSDALARHYKKSKQKIKIQFVKDAPISDQKTRFPRPLGTAGAIKNAEMMIGREERFLVLNGDILSNVDYAQVVKSHISHKAAIATVALYRVKEPSRYGVVQLTDRNRISRFVEKPPTQEAQSSLINAGIYVLEPEIFDSIPVDRPVSLEREVFPKLVKEEKLYGYDFEGLWIDIGKPDDYLKANELWLQNQIRKNQIANNVQLEKHVEIKEPSAIDRGTTIGENSCIGPCTALGKNVTLGKRVNIADSIIFSGTVVSDSSSILSSVVGEAAMIGNNTKIGEGCLIGDHAVIHDGVVLSKNVTVCPSKEVKNSVNTTTCLM